MAAIDVVYSPNIFGVTSFPLKHNGSPVFYKEFDGASNVVVDILNDKIKINDHFFKTGEPLIYKSSFPGGNILIAPNSPGAVGITSLPQIVYPVVINDNEIRIALSETLSRQNLYVNFTGVGIGSVHSFTASKQNSKCIISIDNIMQSPVSIGVTFNITDTNPLNSGEIYVNSLQDIKINSVLKINNEYVKAIAIDYDNKKIFLNRAILGSSANSLAGISTAYVVEGNYNIVEDIIYFTSAPFDGIKYNLIIPVESVIFDTVGISSHSFNIITDKLKNTTSVILTSSNPPSPLVSGNTYNIIKNYEGNYSFALSYMDANSIPPKKIPFIDSGTNILPLSPIDLTFAYTQNQSSSSFQGRVFLRSNYFGNLVADDVSSQFNGISSSFVLKNLGISTVGIKSDNGIILINNIFQYPEFEESFSFNESGGSTNLVFTGNKYPNNTIGFTSIKSYDVNVGGFPRGGIIVGYGLSSGINYRPLSNYENIPVTGSVSGIGASVSFEVNVEGIVSKFKITNPGYGYVVGEKLSPVNVVTSNGFVNDNRLIITLTEVYKDTFSGWNIGQLQKLDDMTPYVNGSRRTFDIKETINGISKLLSLETTVGSNLELSYNLLIFLNDVLQIPNISYEFVGGTQITFEEAPPAGSVLRVYFYRGYQNDSQLINIVPDIKKGDKLRIDKDLNDRVPEVQYQRTVKKILSSDKLETEIYERKGLSKDSSQLRSINWIPQKSDIIIGGDYVSKARPLHDTNVGIFTGIGVSNGTFIGVSTNIVGINTLIGISPYVGINVGDYIESVYTGIGVTVVSVGIGSIKLSKDSTSPAGTSVTSVSVIRKL
jgi:hypothetical protein